MDRESLLMLLKPESLRKDAGWHSRFDRNVLRSSSITLVPPRQRSVDNSAIPRI